jgi:hypothetical protein
VEHLAQAVVAVVIEVQYLEKVPEAEHHLKADLA